MRILLPILSLLVIVCSSCRKQVDERIQGNWKLTRAWKVDFLSRDYFTTGYEDGIFRFEENGSATYTSSTDTLYGYWDADFYYDYNSNGNTDRYKFLRINLVNYQTNKTLIIDLDEFHFRNSWRCIRGTEHTYGRDRVYEFERP